MSTPATNEMVDRGRIPAPGFADFAREAQRAFRAMLDALAHPGRTYPLSGPSQAPVALGPGLAAATLTLLDDSCTVWLAEPLGDEQTWRWLAFHTAAARVEDPGSAGFVLATPASLPSLSALALGSDESPHLSATVLLDVRDARGTTRLTAEGPGIDGTARLPAPWATDALLAQLRDNAALFPRGVDLLLIDAATVTALSRTTRLTAEA